MKEDIKGIDKLYTENRRLQEENKQLKEKLRIDNQLVNDLSIIKRAKNQKADFIKRLKELIKN